MVLGCLGMFRGCAGEFKRSTPYRRADGIFKVVIKLGERSKNIHWLFEIEGKKKLERVKIMEN